MRRRTFRKSCESIHLQDAWRRRVRLSAHAKIELRVQGTQIVQFKTRSLQSGQLPAFLALPAEKKIGDALPGIPIDTTKGVNELVEWLTLVNKAYAGHKTPNLLLKGDNTSKYPSFKAVVDAFKKNDFLKFQMITNPESVPLGSELFKENLKNPAAKAE